MAESPAQSLEALLEDLKSEEIPKKANAMRNISMIGSALGFERCRNELVPYLNEFLDDEEEVLIALAEIIPQLFDLIGGKNYAYLLLDVLERLCAIEDTSVCAAAVSSFKLILSKIDYSKLEVLLLEQIARMNSSEWLNSKISLSILLPVISKEISIEGQALVLDTFRSLLINSNAQIRKIAAENFKNLIGKVHASHESSLQEMLGLLGVDAEDSVRTIAVEDLLCHFSALGTRHNSSLMPVFRMLMDDKSWRVRYIMAEKLPDFAAVMAPEQRSVVLISAMAKFLQDNEPEVRTGACRKLVDFCRLITAEEIVTHIVPVLNPLISDFDYIKATLASNIAKLMPLVGRANSSQHLLPLVLEILRDSSAEIKVCLFSDLEGISGVVGAESLAQILMPSLEELAEDKQWRVKLQVAQCFPVLGRQLGVEFFEQHFLHVVQKLIFDSVYSVRLGVIGTIKDLCQIFGQRWVENNIVREICEYSRDENYSKRLVTILLLKNTANCLTAEFLSTVVVDVLAEMANDVVANIRLNVVKTIKDVAAIVKDPEARESLKMALRVLNKDEDIDVRFYAEQAVRTFG